MVTTFAAGIWTPPILVATPDGYPEYPRIAVARGNQLQLAYFVRDNEFDIGHYILYTVTGESDARMTIPNTPGRPSPGTDQYATTAYFGDPIADRAHAPADTGASDRGARGNTRTAGRGESSRPYSPADHPGGLRGNRDGRGGYCGASEPTAIGLGAGLTGLSPHMASPTANPFRQGCHAPLTTNGLPRSGMVPMNNLYPTLPSPLVVATGNCDSRRPRFDRVHPWPATEIVSCAGDDSGRSDD